MPVPSAVLATGTGVAPKRWTAEHRWDMASTGPVGRVKAMASARSVVMAF